MFGSLAALFVIGFKYVKIALSSGKFLVIGKTLLTMGISIGAYAMLNGWAFAAIFIGLLFVHEMGHVWAAKRIGLPVSAPLFIPFLGAAISMKKNPQSVSHEAYLAAGGPIVGTAGCLGLLTIACATRSAFLFHMAAIGLFLNLFNLIPVSPLDGGRIMAAVSPWIWLVGVLIMVPLLIWMNAYIFLVLIAFMAGPQIRRLFQGRDEQWQVYHITTARQRVYATGAWIGLLILIGVAGVLCMIGSSSPASPILLPGMLLSWVLCGIVGGACFFTWPLSREA